MIGSRTAPCSARNSFSTGQLKAEDVPPTCTTRVYPQVLFNRDKLLEKKENFHMVPGRGLEPPRCYSLVPETSASTNSATRAGEEGRAMYARGRELSIE